MQLLRRSVDVGGDMHPPQRLQRRGIKGLCAERDAVDAGVAVFGEPTALHGCRVRLERHLGVRRQRQLRPPGTRSTEPIASGENRLGVPPPRNTLRTGRPESWGAWAAISAFSACR